MTKAVGRRSDADSGRDSSKKIGSHQGSRFEILTKETEREDEVVILERNNTLMCMDLDGAENNLSGHVVQLGDSKQATEARNAQHEPKEIVSG